MRISITALVFVAAALAGCGEASPDADDPRGPAGPIHEAPEPYFIVVDTSTLTAWGTDRVTRTEFEALEVEAPFVKDAIDNYAVVDSTWLRSPHAPSDGPTERQVLWGVEFEHIVDVVSLPEDVDGAGVLSRTRIVKHHRVTWPAMPTGNTMRLLVNPDGERYALINRRPSRAGELGSLPPGWSHRHVDLVDDVVIELRGELSNIRDDNGDLYQGPIDLEGGA